MLNAAFEGSSIAAGINGELLLRGELPAGDRPTRRTKSVTLAPVSAPRGT